MEESTAHDAPPGEVAPASRDAEAARARPWPGWTYGIAAVVLFLLAIQLLKSAIGAVGPALRDGLPAVVTGDISALGASWLAAYGLLNGSVVAAVAVALYDATAITLSQLLFMVFGSRFGAAGIVLLVGLFDFLAHRTQTVRRASELGLMSFLVTYTIGLPALAMGYAWFYGVGPLRVGGSAQPLQVPHLVRQAGDWLVGTAGPLLGFLAGVVLLMTSLKLFDRVFAAFDMEAARGYYGRVLRQRGWAFLVGVGVTALTTSIAFSLGVLVPMYNRGHVKPREAVPYILGANIGTLVDTVLVALFFPSSGGIGVVLLVVAATAGATLPALVLFGPYYAAIRTLLDRLQTSRWAFGMFLALLVVLPAGLVGLGFVLRGGGV